MCASGVSLAVTLRFHPRRENLLIFAPKDILLLMQYPFSGPDPKGPER